MWPSVHLELDQDERVIAQCHNSQFGHYATNSAGSLGATELDAGTNAGSFRQNVTEAADWFNKGHADWLSRVPTHLAMRRLLNCRAGV